MSVGTISRPGISLPFVCANTPAGMIDDTPITQAEELITPGVNGRRWRTLFDQYPSFQMTTYHEVTHYDAGVQMKRKAEGLVQKLVTLSVTIGGVNHPLKDTHVSAIAVVVHPGPMAGDGVGSGQAHVEITWQLEGTTFA